MSDLLISRRFILSFMEQQRRVSMHTLNEKCKLLISQHVFCSGMKFMAGIRPKRKLRKLHFKRFGIQGTNKSDRMESRRLFYSWRRYLILVCISFRLMFPNINFLATVDAWKLCPCAAAKSQTKSIIDVYSFWRLGEAFLTSFDCIRMFIIRVKMEFQFE